MRYINTLQNQVKERNETLSEISTGILELKSYLLSEKFRCGDQLDGYVNVKDVLLRLEEIESSTWLTS